MPLKNIAPLFPLVAGLFFAAQTAHAIEISPSKNQGGTTNDIPNKTTGAPTLLHTPFKWIFGNPHSEAMKRIQAPPQFKMELTTEPRSFVPMTNATLKVKLIARNESKEKYILEFDTAQHHDLIITKTDGTEVYRLSKKQTFSQSPSTVVLNRNEKLVYEDELFSPSNQVTSLSPGDYKMKAVITSKTPISVETMFWIAP